MPKKSENPYSYRDFVKKYIDFQSKDPRHKYLDKPVMHKEIPDLKGKSVLAIGCGSGGELNYLKKTGAKRIVGIDSSSYMVEASKFNAPGTEIYKMSAERLDFKDESFDFVYSDLAVHYVRDIEKVFSEVYRVLKKGGIFLFSTTHPIEDTLTRVMLNGQRELKILGYIKKNKKVYKVYGDYLKPKKIKNKWWEGGEVTFYYTPLSTIINKAIHSGFSIQQMLEPRPLSIMRRRRPDLYKRMTKIPFLLILELKK